MSMNHWIRVMVVVGVAGASTLWLGGCNTIKGAADDATAVTEGVGNAAEEANPYDDE